MEDNGNMNEIIKTSLDIKASSLPMEQIVDEKHYMKVSFTEIAALGSSFAEMLPSFRSIEQEFGQGAEIYIRDFVNGARGELMKTKNGEALRATVKNANGKFAGNAAFQRMETVNISTVIPYNPQLFIMSMILVGLDRKLDEVKETQKLILGILERDKESQLQADLELLVDILNHYKHYWDNEVSVNLNLSQVKGIKRNARKEIIFYQKQLEDVLASKQSIRIGNKTFGKIDDIFKQFTNYKLALYVYSMASFLDMMFSQSFKSDYIENILEEFQKNAYQYKVFYTKCYDRIEYFLKSSLGTQLIGGVAQVNKTAGKIIEKIPIISRSSIDENLISLGEHVEEKESDRIKKTLNSFINYKNSGIEVFTENIKTVNKLYNEPVGIIFDEENIYLAER